MASLPKELMFDLHNDVRQTDDRILHAGRQTIAHDLSQHLPVEAQFAPDWS